jgi:pimeloyl-ACP methyl ester carboxylesterase
MSTLKVPGAQLYYEVSGDGPPLILIPGAAGAGQVFRPLTGPLAERYQVHERAQRSSMNHAIEGIWYHIDSLGYALRQQPRSTYNLLGAVTDRSRHSRIALACLG